MDAVYFELILIARHVFYPKKKNVEKTSWGSSSPYEKDWPHLFSHPPIFELKSVQFFDTVNNLYTISISKFNFLTTIKNK